MEVTEKYELIMNNIIEECINKKDFNVFKYNSHEELGRYFLNKVCNNIDEVSLEDTKYVVKRICDKENIIKTDKDLFILFAKYLGFNAIPKYIYMQLLREYITIDKKYNKLNEKIANKISEINMEINKLNILENKCISKNKTDLSIFKDLQHYEDELMDIRNKIEDYTIEIEMITYTKKMLENTFIEINCNNDRERTMNKFKKISFNYVNKSDLYIKEFFEYYEEYLEISNDNVFNYLLIVYKVKLFRFYENIYRVYDSLNYIKTEEEILKKINEMKSILPSINELISSKKSDINKYKKLLCSLIYDSSLLEDITDDLEKNCSVKHRKAIILEAINMFKDKKYDIFSNIIAIQIEGIFADYLKDVTTFKRFTDLRLYPHAVLREKIEVLNSVDSGIYMEANLYFKFYFNNKIRNLVAHGNYSTQYNDDIMQEILAMELMLDLNYILYMVTRKSESQKMFNLINNYKDPYEKLKSSQSNNNAHFGALLNDLNCQRVHFHVYGIEEHRPMQVIYWLLNPYYEKIYSQMGDVQKLRDLRNDLLSKEFWEYVNKLLDKEIKEKNKLHKIHYEFKSIVECMFRCIDDNKVLIEVLKKIKKTKYY